MRSAAAPHRSASGRLGIAGLALVGACGGPGAFALERPDEGLGGLAAARAAFVPGDPSAGPARLVVVSADGQLVAFDAEGAEQWRAPTASDRPIVAGALVLTHEGGAVAARELGSGRLRFRESTRGLALVGAAGHGTRGVIVLSTGTSTSPRSEVWMVEEGRVRRRLELAQDAGAPAWAGVAYVPWGSHFLSAVDASGREIARLQWDRTLLSEARTAGDQLWAGSAEAVRLGHGGEPDPTPGALPLGGDPVARAAAALETPVDESWPPALPFRDGYRTPAARGGFADGQWLAWWPGRARPEPLYLVSPRAIVALGPAGDQASWAATLDANATGVLACERALFVTTEDGTLRAWDEVGRPQRTVRLGVAIVGTDFAGDWDAVVDAAPADREDPGPAIDDLETVLSTPDDPRSVAGLVAADMLRASEDPDATAALIRVCQGGARDEPTRALGCEALARRRRGMAHVVTALRGRSDFLAGTRSPPVAALARAAAGAGAIEAVPWLIARLRDPATPSDQLATVASSLGALGQASAVGPLEDFLRLYSADAPDEGVERALGAIVDALVTLRGPLAEAVLVEVADAPFTRSALRGHIEATLRALDTDAAEAADGDPRDGGG